MESVYNKILVQVNMEQKDYAEIGGIKLHLASSYNPNNREKAPVVAHVLKGNDEIKDGNFVITHHNYFVPFSPYEISEGVYSIPYTENIFVVIDENGNPSPVCNNVIAERIEEDEVIGMANPKRLHYHDRVKLIPSGEQVFTLPFSDYEIVYNWNGVEKRIIRIFKDNIVAILKK